MAMVAALGTTVTAAPVAKPRNEAQTAAVLTPYRETVIVDGAHRGPVFQGIGAISGGGGNSRLLIDYPQRERAEMLDYLFSPHFGASL
jgi:Glycosyl hydrolase family 59